jgi:hypothetical protein
MFRNGTTTPSLATPERRTAGAIRRAGLTAEERETILVYNDADRTWSVYSDSTRRRRIERWLRGLGIEPRRLAGGGIEGSGIPDWALSFRKRRQRRPATSAPATPARRPFLAPKLPSGRGFYGVQGARETQDTGAAARSQKNGHLEGVQR